MVGKFPLEGQAPPHEGDDDEHQDGDDSVISVEGQCWLAVAVDATVLGVTPDEVDQRPQHSHQHSHQQEKSGSDLPRAYAERP